MMDINRHLRRWLNKTSLSEHFDNKYEGVIEDVIEETIRHHFTRVPELQPVIKFADGWRLCPNIGMRLALREFWGANTEDWIGRRLVVYQHVERRANGTEGWVKRVMKADAEISRFPRRAGGGR